jgi:hypothetical protein
MWYGVLEILRKTLDSQLYVRNVTFKSTEHEDYNCDQRVMAYRKAKEGN